MKHGAETDILVRYIHDHIQTWQDDLTKPPYNLTIKKDDRYVLLKYNQITSDFSRPIVRGARGVIIDLIGLKIVCRPFTKFFNYAEQLADTIEWESAVVEEKLDGSIIKFWWDGAADQWQMSTNGVIYGHAVPVMFARFGVHTFGDMVREATGKSWREVGSMLSERNATHIFEIVGPENRVVVPYDKHRLVYLTSFNNMTGVEHTFDFPFERPARFDFSDLDSILAYASGDFNTFRNEGFVVRDRFSRRIKIKTEDYLRLHRLRGENSPTTRRFIELWKTNESEEFLSYFPEYRDAYDEVVRRIEVVVASLHELEAFVNSGANMERKDFAKQALGTRCPVYLFGRIDKKWSSPEEYLYGLTTKSLEGLLS